MKTRIVDSFSIPKMLTVVKVNVKEGERGGGRGERDVLPLLLAGCNLYFIPCVPVYIWTPAIELSPGSLYKCFPMRIEYKQIFTEAAHVHTHTRTHLDTNTDICTYTYACERTKSQRYGEWSKFARLPIDALLFHFSFGRGTFPSRYCEGAHIHVKEDFIYENYFA